MGPIEVAADILGVALGTTVYRFLRQYFYIKRIRYALYLQLPDGPVLIRQGMSYEEISKEIERRGDPKARHRLPESSRTPERHPE